MLPLHKGSTYSYFFALVLIHFYILVNSNPLTVNYDIWNDENNGKESHTEKENIYKVQQTNKTRSVTSRHLRKGKQGGLGTFGALNFFPVPVDDECISDDGRRAGVCLNAYECRIQNGASHGRCAFGLGVCCIFTAYCDMEVYNNITYIVSPNFPALSRGAISCTHLIRKIDPEISQIRFDFIHFIVGQPNRITGVCENEVLTISGGPNKELKMCGLNSGQHVYFDVENINEPINITMNFTKKNMDRLWEIKVLQIPFSDRAPAGCLQYHRGKKGIIQTFNFADNGRHLSNQEYTICTRQEQGMCSIVYEPCDENSFRIGPNEEEGSGFGNDLIISNNTNSSFSEARSCSDRIFLPCDSEELILPGMMGPSTCDIAHCGSSLCPTGENPCRIESSTTPFNIGVQFGSTARMESPEDNLGMCLQYEQQACSV